MIHKIYSTLPNTTQALTAARVPLNLISQFPLYISKTIRSNAVPNPGAHPSKVNQSRRKMLELSRNVAFSILPASLLEQSLHG